MTNIEKLQHDVEVAQKQLEEATKSLEMAKKKLSKISLKVPEMGERYYSYYHSEEGNRTDSNTDAYLHSFDSTNKAQQRAFQEALVVMAEMRMQDGIVVPNGNDDFYFISTDNYQEISIDMWCNCIGLSLFPAFESIDALQTAINAVGERRIINCIKTMMFMTPESRGEA